MSQNEPADEMFEKALDIAEKHLDAALREGGPAAAYVAVAMLEVSVNQAVAAAGPEDVIAIMQDLIAQIEAEGMADGEDDGE